MGFLSKLFSSDKKKDDQTRVKAIDYEMQALERELQEYEARKQAASPSQQPAQQGQAQPAQAQPAQAQPDKPGENADTAVKTPAVTTTEEKSGENPPEGADHSPFGLTSDEEPEQADIISDEVFDPSGGKGTVEYTPQDDEAPKEVNLEETTKVVDVEAEQAIPTDFGLSDQSDEDSPSEDEVAAAQAELGGAPESPVEKQPEQAPEEQPVQEMEPVDLGGSEASADEIEDSENPLLEVQEMEPVQDDEAPEVLPSSEPLSDDSDKMEPVQEVQPETETQPETAPEPEAQPEPAQPEAEAAHPAEAAAPAPEQNPVVVKLGKIIGVLEAKVASMKAEGKDVTEVEPLVQQARADFDAKKYKTAKEIAVQAKGKLA